MAGVTDGNTCGVKNKRESYICMFGIYTEAASDDK
jgi:hypothetical protein